MLKITEYPHRLPVRQWFANDEADFCRIVCAANPRSDIDPNATFAEMVNWLGSDLRAIEVEEVQEAA